MGFLDKLFKPKWKHEDSKIRIKVVKELDNQKTLIEIVKSDSDENVRKEAVKKIDNNSILADVAKTDSDENVR